MAKIRGVKPEFWTDEKIVELSRDARLLFIGLWNFACDNGHVDDKPRQIKMRIFPGDDDTDVEGWLDELATQGRIERRDGVIIINRFAHHQRPHKRWWTTCDLPWCTLPEDAPPQGRNRGATVAHQESNGSATADGDGEGEGDTSSAPATPSREATPPATKASTSPDRFPEFWAAYPRKKDKGHALKAWTKATRTADPQVIIDAARNQAPQLTARGVEFCPYPATWLNGQRWADETDQTVDADPWAHVPVIGPKAVGQ